MSKSFIIFVCLIFCVSCQIPTDNEFQKLDTANFDLQLENYKYVIKVEIIEVKYSLNKKPYAYPVDVVKKAKVLETYRGKTDKPLISLVTSCEEIPTEISPQLGKKYFFFFNDDDKFDSNIYRCEFRLWEYSDAYQKYLKSKL